MKRLFAVIAISTLHTATAQQPQPPTLELPELVIIGKEERRIPTGVKQPPQPSAPLPAVVLDSLNPLRKHLLLGALPIPPFPDTLGLPRPRKLLLYGALGQYGSAELGGGAFVHRDGLELSGTAQLAATQGDRQGADSSGLALAASLRAPLPRLFDFEQHWVRVGVEGDWRRYRLYANPALLRRALLLLAAAVEMQGRADPTSYALGAALELAHLRQEEREQTERLIRLHGLLRTAALLEREIELSGQLLLQQQMEETQLLASVQAATALQHERLFVDLKGGLQVGHQYDGTALLTPLVRLQAQYALQPAWRLVGELRSGWRERSLGQLLAENPYTALGKLPELLREGFVGAFGVALLPAPELAVEATLQLRSVDGWYSWRVVEDSSLHPQGLRLHAQELHIVALWQPLPSTRFGAQVQLGSASVPGRERAPYYAPAVLRATAEHRWAAQWSALLGTEIVAQRWREDGPALPAYVRLFAQAGYRLVEGLELGIRVDNALNAEILRWAGYPERRIFVQLLTRWYR